MRTPISRHPKRPPPASFKFPSAFLVLAWLAFIYFKIEPGLVNFGIKTNSFSIFLFVGFLRPVAPCAL